MGGLFVFQQLYKVNTQQQFNGLLASDHPKPLQKQALQLLSCDIKHAILSNDVLNLNPAVGEVERNVIEKAQIFNVALVGYGFPGGF